MGLLAKLLMTHQLKMEMGNIVLKDIRMSMVPSIFIGEMTEYFMQKNELPKLYMLAWFWGFDLVKRVKEKFNLKKPSDVYSVGMNLGQAMGIGLYKTHDYFPGRYTHFVIPNNPFIKFIAMGRKFKEPVDYYICGCMGGGGCLVHDAVCQNVELRCIATGSNACEFLTATEKELKDRKLWKIAENRYNLSNLLPLQEEIYKKHGKVKSSKLIEKVMSEL